MSLSLGNTNIKDVYFGSTKIKEAYLGSSKVYSSSTPLPTVLMPDGKYWTSTDLDVDDGLGEIFRYNNISVNGYDFGVQYYYSHTAAKRVAESINGFHLPTQTEWTTLLNSIDSNNYSVVSLKLRNTYGWSDDNGTNDYGFTVLPIGNMNKTYTGDQSDLETVGTRTCYWCYDNNAITSRHDCIRINQNGIYISNEASIPTYNFCFKVRLIKD